MKIDCIHGYFIFEETSSGQISEFMSRYGLSIEKENDRFIFSDLVGAPEYSIQGALWMGAPCITTFEGPPWEIMRENGLVYNFLLGLVVPINSILQVIDVKNAGKFYISNGMILPGSVTDDGSRVTDYSAFYARERENFKYSEIDYE